MNKNITKLLVALLLIGTPTIALASIELVTIAEIEITETGKDGVKKVKRVPASKVVPGTEVIYTITAKNTGEQPVQNISIKDPVPEHMTYLAGSAKGKNTRISFSVDGGKSFANPGKLTVKTSQGKIRKANAEDYTHVQWILNFELKPGQSTPVSFRAKLK